MGTLVPEKSFLLCEKIQEDHITKSGLIVTKDSKSANFTSYRVIAAGTEVADFFKAGEVIIADEENVNVLTYKGKTYWVMSDAFVVLKVK